jgi:hypothetical protein
MFSDRARPHPSSSDTPEAGLRLGMMLAEIWYDWFEAMSEVAYQTHRACEFFIESGGPSHGRHRPFDFRHSPSPSEGPNGSIDMDKFKECLQALDPMQAARVMHAVQMMQAMESMIKKRRSRADKAEEAAW